MGLKIYKIAEKVFRHNDTVKGDFVLSKFYAKEEFEKFIVVEIYGSEHLKYSINEIEVYDIGGMAETFANFDDLFVRLAELRYTAFYADGESEVNWGFILGDINSQTDLINRLNLKLNNDISTYTDVTLPLIDTDEFLVNRGGTWYKVDKSEIGGNALFLKWNHTYSENNAGYTGSSGRLVVYTVEIPSNIILDENTFIEFDAISTVEAGAVGSCTTEVHITDNVPTADLSTLIAYFNRGGTGLQQSVSRKMTMLNTTDFWVLPNNRNIQSDYSSISNSFNRMVISGFSPTKRNITVVFLKTNIADIMKFTDFNIKIYQNS